MVVSIKNCLKGAVVALASVPVVTAGLLISVDSAQGSVLFGGFLLSPGNTSEFGSSTVTLTKNSLNFLPQPITPVVIEPVAGSFAKFNTGNIRNNITFGTPVKADYLFMDLGSLPINGLISSNTDTSSLTDGKNTFTVTGSAYELIDGGISTMVDVSVWGFFTGENSNEITNAVGNITFTIGNRTIGDVREILNANGSISDLTFSGSFFPSVCGRCGIIPEPATILGLVLFGGGMAITRRPKNVG
ncbi:PEP-CTERM sorting domain-containing protein [Nostoc parmelioides]|uniref:PEP-CTERM sorting domain-containing protein n=1 Tax=Nostoc parmelioides FACHB-3921 TaxID=2692909 RepID=A0ABR8BMQ7_9NOSO|nr:PEP-CTERM sorting domain-containing protein [Nostoc parmelioides]MBD2254527.1 PEP-CTERM sorting domain-containing protein [Nostoc parmelioides FACHB-3921]